MLHSAVLYILTLLITLVIRKYHVDTCTFQFLGDTFNALFAIMEEMAEEVGDLVFEALVRILLYSLQ